MDLELKDKVAVITGASTGIGLAVALTLGREGSQVVLCARNEARLTDAANAVASTSGVTALPVVCDVTQSADIGRLAKIVEERFGGADILISNAGEGTNETILGAPDERWQHYWELHVMAAVRLARGLVPGMRRRGGGAILHNASICATQPLYHEPIYNVTKAALVMLSKCLSEELIRDHIRVNCINPGLIETTPWIDYAKKAVEGQTTTWQAHLSQIAADKAPIGRFASPEELADFMAFLVSPRASYCVGSTYYVDGGWLKVVT
jgi:NAD(P)-dependent dehydrogenase (short-subunit alcohol dehydrogenase family)